MVDLRSLVWFLEGESELEVVVVFFLIGFDSFSSSNILLLLTLLWGWTSLCAGMNERVNNTKTRQSTKSTLVKLQECCGSGAICTEIYDC
ncbi:hypothetical protein RND71_031395 [Anisodus tanguticus]|uniref:Uncharacterized protein n=1 Tax=Anisodus tanguticus TaxID=243964 RepID=A0AAE1V5K2_9SOLA|nr:hypothetical protein RND71_031395 [Anisodus tanguticus]